MTRLRGGQIYDHIRWGPLVSLLLHLDGVGLTRSTQLKLWLFSGSIVELPPKLHNRRYNMIALSIWVGHSEPETEI